MLLMNKRDQSRPLDARPGHDPFGGTDPTYSCDGLHEDSTCVGQPHKCRFHGTCRDRVVRQQRRAAQRAARRARQRHDPRRPLGRRDLGRLQAAGPADDARSTACTAARARTSSTPATAGTRSPAAAGADRIHAHFGHGIIRCSRRTIAYLSRRSIKRYKLRGCRRISFKTLGY